MRGDYTLAPYGFELSETCASCKFRRDGFFCQLLPAELKDFDAIKHISAYPADALLFGQQQKSRGFFQLCEGEVKLSLSSSEGKTLIVRVAKSGDVIGMWAAISGAPYEVTAECLRPCQVAFVSSTDFRQFLRKHPAVFERAANHLGLHYKSACEQLSAVGLGATVLEKVARFLLDWSTKSGAPNNESPFTLSLSHEEIGEYIAATRESVTRALSEFRNLGLIETYGSTFIIRSRDTLAAIRLREDQTQSFSFRPQLARLSHTVLQREPRAFQWSEWQRRANRRKRA